MSRWPWQRLLGVGGALLIVGIALPLAMVIGLLPSTYGLNFLAYGASIAGLFIGTYGVNQMIRASKDGE